MNASVGKLREDIMLAGKHILTGGGPERLGLHDTRLYEYLLELLRKLESPNDSSFSARKRPSTDVRGVSKSDHKVGPPVGLYRPKYDLVHKNQDTLQTF